MIYYIDSISNYIRRCQYFKRTWHDEKELFHPKKRTNEEPNFHSLIDNHNIRTLFLNNFPYIYVHTCKSSLFPT